MDDFKREFTDERGYVAICQYDKDVRDDYVRMAYGLALSIKATQSGVNKLSILVDEDTKVPLRYRHAFDQVIRIPWGDDAYRQSWKIHNKWKVPHITPYKETVLLDADMIFPADISHWWDLMDDRSMWITTKPSTYRGEPISQEFYRWAFHQNSLPMVYTAFMYFKVNDEVLEFADTLRMVFRYWENLFFNYKYREASFEELDVLSKSISPDKHNWTHFIKNYPYHLSGDLGYAMACKILGKEEEYCPNFDFPTFVHMKSNDQNLEGGPFDEDWTNLIPSVLKEDLTLIVGNHVQKYPFHYNIKEWLTEEKLYTLECANE